MYGKHFKYADDKIAALLAIIFNAMIINDLFLPECMLDTIIVVLNVNCLQTSVCFH